MEPLIPEADFLPKVGDIIVMKITFSLKDTPLTAWAQSVPRGLFSNTVKAAIMAYLQHDPTYILPQYPQPEMLKDVVVKGIAIGKADYELYCYLFSKKPRTRAREIKSILRFFMRQQAAASAATAQSTTPPTSHPQAVSPQIAVLTPPKKPKRLSPEERKNRLWDM